MSATVAAITLVAKEVGLPLAKKIIGMLGSSNGGEGKLTKAIEAVEKGVSVMTALRQNFGGDFDTALNEVTKSGESGWSYEAGASEYVKILNEDAKIPSQVLRDELNINLDRISATSNRNNIETLNYFRGVVSEWMRRYDTLIGLDKDARSTFRDIDTLLDGSRRTFKDALSMLARTGLGTTGALMVIASAMLATSTSVGLFTWISTLLIGVPWIAVATIAIPGVLLLALSRVTFSENHAMSACVALAYKLLQRHEDAAAV